VGLARVNPGKGIVRLKWTFDQENVEKYTVARQRHRIIPVFFCIYHQAVKKIIGADNEV